MHIRNVSGMASFVHAAAVLAGGVGCSVFRPGRAGRFFTESEACEGRPSRAQASPARVKSIGVHLHCFYKWESRLDGAQGKELLGSHSTAPPTRCRGAAEWSPPDGSPGSLERSECPGRSGDGARQGLSSSGKPCSSSSFSTSRLSRVVQKNLPRFETEGSAQSNHDAPLSRAHSTEGQRHIAAAISATAAAGGSSHRCVRQLYYAGVAHSRLCKNSRWANVTPSQS
ncbi:hypothetical protein E2C01_074740 [Portunus trituberculatus]|uniref:Uncharacterized protein n=1 Tax=Portunus trituberculatus TaxID=210409 RepID=A0A5B7I449_PORTR|nr:hypothetical protein [Portunus trituberculatus]